MNFKALYFLILVFLLTTKGYGYALVQDPVQLKSDTIEGLDHTGYRLLKPVSAGDNQYARIKTQLSDPVVIRVVDAGNRPIPGYTVRFKVLSQPEKAQGFSVVNDVSVTDSSGNAGTGVILGSKEGDYQLSARIEGSRDDDFLLFTFHARKPNWLLMLIIGLLGGLGLFLLGMDMLSEGMKKSAGEKMRSILGNLTKNRFLGLGLGVFVTMIIQSSSATSVMLVGFVNSKLMKFRRTIGIILGANIGTTITAQLIAFKLTDYSLLMVAIGFGFLYLSKKQGYKFVGQSILGFGILFFGMHIMSEAMYPIRSYAPFIHLLQELEMPVFGILVGMIFTAILQSSSAFIGITIVLASQGFLTIEAAIPLLLGSNIGTAITAFLASIKASREAKKVALANALINVFGMLILVLWIPGFAHIIELISPKSMLPSGDPLYLAETVPRQIANAHTVFNIMLAAIIIPFTGFVARMINRIFPEREEEKGEMQTMYLDENLISTPVLGLNLAKKEAMRIGSVVQEMLSDAILPFLTKEKILLSSLSENERMVDFLADKTNTYLVLISRQEIDSDRINEAFQIMYTIKELEEMADIIGNLMVTRAETWINEDVEFSGEGKKELVEYHTITQKQLSRALEVFRDLNLEKAKYMTSKHRKYRAIASELEKMHYQRLLEAGRKLEQSGDTHMELMTRLRSINHHATNIARIILDWNKGNMSQK